MKVHPPHPQRGQQLQQLVVFSRHLEVQAVAQVTTAIIAAQQHRLALALRHQLQAQGLAAVQLCQLVHVLLGAAAEFVGNHENFRQLTGGHQGQQRPAAFLPGGVRRQELGHVAGIARMLLCQQLLGAVHPLLLLRPEADPAGVIHEAVGQMQVAPAGALGALAPVVFLAVATAESLLVEQANGVQAVAAQIHATAYPGGYRHHVVDAELTGEAGIQLRHRQAEQQRIVAAKIRKTADRGVVAEGRDTGHALVVVDRLAQAPQPVVGDFHVAVEQQHVALHIVLHAAVDRGDETAVVVVFQQHEIVTAGIQLPQVGGNGRVRGAVVDHHHPGPGGIDGGQCRSQASPSLFQPLVNRDDDVNRAHGASSAGG